MITPLEQMLPVVQLVSLSEQLSGMHRPDWQDNGALHSAVVQTRPRSSRLLRQHTRASLDFARCMSTTASARRLNNGPSTVVASLVASGSL